MEEAIEFIRDYIKKEYQAGRAQYGEPDDEVYQQKVLAARSFLDPRQHIEQGLFRPMPSDEKWFNRASEMRTRVVARPLFLVRQHRNAERGDLFRCVVGDKVKYPTQGYSEAWFVAQTDEGLKIIATHTLCRTCHGYASAKTPCTKCGTNGAAIKCGANLGKLGPVVATRKISPPTEPKSLALFDKD